MAQKFTIGIDLGGTNLKAGVVDSLGKVSHRISVPVGRNKSAPAIIKLISGQVAALKKKCGKKICAVGLGIPGIVDIKTGTVLRSPHYGGWVDVPMRDEIARALNLPIALDNDANMHAIGELKFGAGKGCRNLVLLTLGTGIGGGLVFDEKVFHGDDGGAGEVGHIVLDPNGPPCGCGGRGCWEIYAAARALEHGGLAPKDFAERAKAGDKAAIELWKTYGRYLGIGIATLVNTLGVYTFIIGGGISNSWDLFIKSAREELKKHTYEHHAEHISLKRSALGNDAGIIGAATEALKLGT